MTEIKVKCEFTSPCTFFHFKTKCSAICFQSQTRTNWNVWSSKISVLMKLHAEGVYSELFEGDLIYSFRKNYIFAFQWTLYKLTSLRQLTSSITCILYLTFYLNQNNELYLVCLDILNFEKQG